MGPGLLRLMLAVPQAFGPLVPNWREFFCVLREGNNETCQGHVIISRCLGCAWETPVAFGSKRAVWAPGARGSLPVERDLVLLETLWLGHALPQLPDLPPLRCAGCGMLSAAFTWASWRRCLGSWAGETGGGSTTDSDPTALRRALGTVSLCKVSVLITCHQI